MAKPFTAKYVETVKPDPKKRLELPDPALSGLYLIVQSSGKKSWACRYRFDGKPRKLTLDRYPRLSLAEARKAATDALDAVARGNDPGAAKQEARNAKKAADLDERHKVHNVLALYDKRHLSRLKSGATVKRELDRFMATPWGERKVQDIEKRDVVELIDEVADSGRVVTANRLRAYLSKFFGWCADRDIIQHSPALHVPKIGQERARERVLSDDEVRWLWLACEAVSRPWGPLGQCLLLTGQRYSEVAGMTEDEIEGDEWVLPSERVKNGRQHTVPLVPKVQGILGRMDRIGSAGLFHTTNGRTPVSGSFKGRNSVHAKMLELAEAETGEPAEIEHWTWHDLRRTCATGMAKLRVPVRTTEAVLNHVSGTAAGIVSVYQRHSYSDEKREALQAWTDYVETLVEGKEAANVTRLGAYRG